jgi:hypothetical protein
VIELLTKGGEYKVVDPVTRVEHPLLERVTRLATSGSEQPGRYTVGQ